MSATIRAVTSAGPPAAKGTIIVTALAGYSSATAPVIVATISRTAAAHCLVMMVSPTSFVDPRQPISVRTLAAASHIAFNLPNAKAVVSAMRGGAGAAGREQTTRP